MDHIFKGVNQCRGVVFCYCLPELVQRAGERVQTIIVVLVRLLRRTAKFIYAVIAVLTCQPDLADEGGFIVTYQRLLHCRQEGGKIVDGCAGGYLLADSFPSIERYIPCLDRESAQDAPCRCPERCFDALDQLRHTLLNVTGIEIQQPE